MKKILTVSMIAMLAVTNARADVVSKAYVDPAEGGNYMSISATTGENINTLDNRAYTNTGALTTLTGSGDGSVSKAVADKIGTLPGNAATVEAALSTITTTTGTALNGVSDDSTAGIVVNVGKVGNNVVTTKRKVQVGDFADGAIEDSQLADGVQTKLGLANTAIQSNTVTDTYASDGTAPVSKTAVESAFTTAKTSWDTAYAPAAHTHVATAVTSMGENYAKASAVADVATTDSLDEAIGKLHKDIDAMKGFMDDYTNEVSSRVESRIQQDLSYAGNDGAGVVVDASESNGVVSVDKRKLVSTDFADGAIARTQLDTSTTTALDDLDSSLQNTNSTAADGMYIYTKTVSGTGANATVSYAWEPITGRSQGN